MLQHLNSPLGVSKIKARSLRLKSQIYCILDNVLFWKDPEGILLNCLVESVEKEVMNDCGSHLYWKTTANKIVRAGYYWPSLFSDVYKTLMSCHECQIFQGKRKLLPLPLQPISIQAPFKQWGLDFIGEIHLSSLAEHVHFKSNRLLHEVDRGHPH